MIRTVLRRTIKAAMIVALGALVAAWFRNRDQPAIVEGVAQWPPLDDGPTAAAAPEREAPAVREPSDGSAAPAPPGDWIAPDADGSCPLSHPVKVKLRSGIYHTPSGAVYERTNADRCYPDAGAAEADGYRASKT